VPGRDVRRFAGDGAVTVPRLLAALRSVGRPTLAAVSVALLGLAVGGAYVAFGAEATRRPSITSGPAQWTNQTSGAFAYTSKSSVTFLCSLDGAAFSPCGSGTGGSTSYAGPLSPGSHAFRVEAQSGTWTSKPSVWKWTIDTTPPPPPWLARKPSNPTTQRNSTFEYKDGEHGISFRCKLDGASYSRCSKKEKYRNLAQGWHTFCVVALDRAGNVSPETCYGWQIGAGAAPVSISGSPLAGDLLYPGATGVAINLVFTNPSATPITIQSVAVTVSGTSAPGCATANFTVAQQLTATPVVPGNSTRSLQDLGVPQADWPKLQMAAGGNQNACQNAAVDLAYSGTATG
jgi:hypothetical protein